MFTPITQTIDFISHFIGEMRIPLEDLRARSNPDDGPNISLKSVSLSLDPGKEAHLEVDDIPVGSVSRKDYIILEGKQAQAQLGEVSLHMPQIHVAPFEMQDLRDITELPSTRAASGITYILPEPGNFVAVIQQQSFLFDQDIVVVGTPDLDIPAPSAPRAELAELLQEGREVTADRGVLEPLKSESALPQFASQTHTLIHAADAPIVEDSLTGIWVNGARTDAEAPELADYLPEEVSPDRVEDEEDGEAPVVSVIEIDASQTGTSMTISSGHNLSVNEAKLVSAGMTATTIAVAGDHYSIDAIVQVNVLSVSTQVDEVLPTLFSMSTAENVLMNIAEYRQVTEDAAGKMAEANPGAMPQNWAVTVVESDLVFLNWLSQYNFTADGDTLVLTATGTTTTIGTGENMSMNATGILYAGMSYDLLLVGGNLYDINYITQLNVLYDHDTLSVAGAMPGNSGTVEAQGNVLWNQGQIARIGASEWSHDMPEHYLETMKRLDEGNKAMPQELRHDPNFEGYANLKVLYVKGNIYDVNYIEQVNVMGDPDQVKLYAEETFGKAVEWSVQTGGNVLVNAASIVDYESMGDKAYVQGKLYSEALLIQSEIIHTGQEAPTQIVTEAVAFIAEDMDSGPEMPTDVLNLAALAAHGPDGLDSILS